MRAESYNALLLYRLTTEIDNGKEKVYKAFTGTRWNLFRDLSTLVKKFIKNNPEDTEKVCQIVDEVFLGKLSDEEFLDYVGKNETTLAYLDKRSQEKAEGITVDGGDSDVISTSDEIIDLEGSSDNPFTE